MATIQVEVCTWTKGSQRKLRIELIFEACQVNIA